jgi:DNA-directed RNA polymerase subunit RPC12/RpoP
MACPECGEEVEFFPQDQVIACTACGSEVKRMSSACISHCPAKESYCYRQMVRNQALSGMKHTSG